MDSATPRQPAPFLKWAGGKRALLPAIHSRIRPFTGRYFEPFVGAGAVLFTIGSNIRKFANDTNEELINTYLTIANDVEALIASLSQHKNEKSYFLKIRSLDRHPEFRDLDLVARASRFIYLNRTCFNGLYRVNSRGQFNVPFGDQKNPDIVMAANLREVSKFLNVDPDGSGGVTFSNGSFETVTAQVQADDLVYFDPPYDPVSKTSSFVSYSKKGFGKDDQSRLAHEAERLVRLGAQVVLSNSDTPFIRSLYSDSSLFKVETVDVRRAIGASTHSRKHVPELIITSCPPK